MNNTAFSILNLRSELAASIAALSYQEMTPVQAQGLPVLLQGKDLIAQAQTGSGKTAAFAISLLNSLDSLIYSTQALVLCPTRELAEQVATEIRRLASNIPNIKLLTLCGGKPLGAQLNSLQRDPHIVVGTPGRILKHLAQGSLKLQSVRTLVLDEADRMLDMGFHDDIMQVIGYLPEDRQSLLFSATYPDQIEMVSKAVQRNPVFIRIESSHKHNAIEQLFYKAGKAEKSEALIRIIAHYRPESSLVFCNTRQQCQQLTDQLRDHDLHTLALHGDMEQGDRDQVLAQFSGKSSSILIATDVAARGLDIKELELVINYELCRDPEMHIHRIGRTGRAGSKGLAISLFTDAESRSLKAIEEYQDAPAIIRDLDSLQALTHFKLYPRMVTLFVNGGRKHKIRAGDLVGALTADKRIAGAQIGKIFVFDRKSYVAIEQKVAKLALSILSEENIKGSSYKVRRLP